VNHKPTLAVLQSSTPFGKPSFAGGTICTKSFHKGYIIES